MTGHRLQEPPNAVQLEMVEGCQLRCQICGLNGIRGKENNYKFMTKDTLRSVMQQMVDARWNPRIEWAMHGENTMHPDYIGMVALAREIAPKFPLMMTSNGGGLLRSPGIVANIQALFDAGLDTLALDDYNGVNIVPKIRQAVGSLSRLDLDVRVFNYPADGPIASPHARVKHRRLIYVEDISQAVAGNHSLINNHAGAGAPKVGPDHRSQTQRCAKPFRELAVRWDGNVSICCNSWRGEYKCGNVVRDGLDAVWNGKAMHAARVVLYHGKRDLIETCRGCDAISYRVGLLPDKYGKESLPEPSRRELRHIEDAQAGPPYTQPVLRDWEK